MLVEIEVVAFLMRPLPKDVGEQHGVERVYVFAWDVEAQTNVLVS